MDTNALYITTIANVIGSILPPMVVAADGTCNGPTDFFDLEENVCKRCTLCYPGTQSTAERCGHGQGTQGICEECKENFFQDKYNTVDACTKCTVCDQAEGIIQGLCQKNKDRQCGCKPGFAAFPQQPALCVKCDLLPDPPDSCQQHPTSTVSGTTLKNNYYTTILSGGSVTSNLHTVLIVCGAVFGSIFVVLVLTFVLRYYISHGRNHSIRLSQGSHHSHSSENGHRIALPDVAVIAALGHQDPSTLEEPTETCILLTTPNANRSRNSVTTPDNNLNSSGASRMLESNNVTWTPKNTPPLNRSLSAPVGSLKSMEKSPQTEGTMPVLPEETRAKAIQYVQTAEEKAMEEKKQKARSIGAGLRLEDLRYDISEAMAKKLAIQEDKTSVSDWRKLAVRWGYTTSIHDISSCKRPGFEMLVVNETTQKPRTKSLEHLFDDLESIKRMDVALLLMNYLLNYKPIV